MTAPRWSVLALLLGAGACTLDAGHGFATLTEAALEVKLDPASARIDGDTVLTESGARVQLETVVVTVSRIELQQLEGSVGAGGTFDPADPPDGYSLCHGGHCHSADGRLVSYEEIQAELSGGSVTWAPIVAIPIARELDVLAGERVVVDAFEPSAELPRGTIGRVYVALDRIRITGTASGGPLAREVPVELDVALEDAGWVATVSRALDRDQPAEIALEVTVPVGGRIFDGVDWTATAPDPTPVITSVLGTDLSVTL